MQRNSYETYHRVETKQREQEEGKQNADEISSENKASLCLTNYVLLYLGLKFLFGYDDNLAISGLSQFLLSFVLI